MSEPRALFANTLASSKDDTADGLTRLVLALVETLRELVERQAVRRVESGSLSEEEIERLGLALIRLEERMNELKKHFGFSNEDLTLRLGGFRDLAEEVRHER